MSFLSEELSKFNIFSDRYFKNNEFLQILKKDREFKILEETWYLNSENTFFGFIRNLKKYRFFKFIMVYALMIFFLQLVLAFTGGFYSMISAFMLYLSTLFVANISVNALYKKVDIFLYKDDENKVKHVLANKKTKKYWLDYFHDNKLLKSAFKENQVMLFSLLRLVLLSKELDNKDEQKTKLGELLSNWVEKGLSRDVLSSIIDFLVYPTNMKIVTDCLNLQKNIKNDLGKKDFENLLFESEQILTSKKSIDVWVEDYLEIIESKNQEEEEIVFFKQKDLKSEKVKLKTMVNSSG